MPEPAPAAASTPVGRLDEEIAFLASSVESLRQQLREKVRERRALARVEPLHEVIHVILTEHPGGLSMSELVRALQARGRLLTNAHPAINVATQLKRHRTRFTRRNGRWYARRQP